MTGEDFKGKAIPFGAKVYFKPTDTREKTYSHKFDPKGIPGIFAGYVITVGQGWSRKYRVWDMKEFANANLSNDAAVTEEIGATISDGGHSSSQDDRISPQSRVRENE